MVKASLIYFYIPERFYNFLLWSNVFECSWFSSVLHLHYCIKICTYRFIISDGLDFFYASENHARKMVDFIQSMLPIRSSHSKKLISHDIHSNIYNYKFTFSIEIVPLSKDSLVCLPKKLTQQLGGISPICLVHRVTSTIHLIDANTGQGM